VTVGIIDMKRKLYDSLKCYMADTGLLISHSFDKRDCQWRKLQKAALRQTGSQQRLYYRKHRHSNAVCERTQALFLL